MPTLENQSQVVDIGGPCRDRTYDQLIKRRHTGTHASCSLDLDNAATQRLETTPFRGVLHSVFARYLGPFSMACAAILVASSALADFPKDVVAKAGNNAGGEIVFTTRATPGCKDRGLEAYATTKEGNVITGCWRIVDDYFVLTYDDGTKRAYKADGLTFSDWFLAVANKPKGTPL